MKRRLMIITLQISAICLLLVLCLILPSVLLSPGMFHPLSKASDTTIDSRDTSGSAANDTGEELSIPLEDAAYPKDLPPSEDPYDLFALYDFLYIGDSYIERLADSGIIHESCTVLAKSGTAAEDWYTKEGNDRYVDYMMRLESLADTPFRGIIVNYGINKIKNKKNISYMEQLIDDIHDTFPDVPLFILKVMPVAEQFVLKKDGVVTYTSDSINRAENRSVVSYNEAIEQYCRHMENVYFVDPTAGFVDKKGNMKQDHADKRGLHIAPEYEPDWCRNIFEGVTAR